MSKKKKIWALIGLLALVVFVSGGMMSIDAWSSSDDGEDLPTPLEIGADFMSGDMSFLRISDPSVTKQQAKDTAVDEFLSDFGMPKGKGVETNVALKATTASFSGSRHDYGPKTINNRPVWIVVVEDIPVSLPCGLHAYDPDSDDPPPCPRNTPKYHVAIDAETGAILSTALTGSGGMSERWYTILADQVDNPQPTPATTPTPTRP